MAIWAGGIPRIVSARTCASDAGFEINILLFSQLRKSHC
jgi:hypothetical protein